MGSCQNLGPFLGTLNNRCRIIIGAQKGTLILDPNFGNHPHGCGGEPAKIHSLSRTCIPTECRRFNDCIWEFPKIGDPNMVP